MNYRTAVVDDVDKLAAFAAVKFVEAYRDQTPMSQLTTYADENLSAACIRQEIADPFARLFVAEDEGELTGYALLKLESTPECELSAEKPAQLQRIYVDPLWQGRGVARELLGRCLAEARASGCDCLWLSVWDANPRAIRFYLKSGFQIIGEQPFILGDDVQRDFVMAQGKGVWGTGRRG